MRPGQQKNRSRGRGRHSGGGGGNNNNNQHRGQNLLSRTMDSNGPDVKIRGTPTHIYEKYLQLARDAHSGGDRVQAENYLQHAEHYYRLIMAAQAQMPQAPQGQHRGPNGHSANGAHPHAEAESAEAAETSAADDESDASSEQPAID